MIKNRNRWGLLILLSVVLPLACLVGCSFANEAVVSQIASPTTPAAAPSASPSDTPFPASTATPPIEASPTATPVIYDPGQDITISYLRDLDIKGSQITFERALTPTFYYESHVVSYLSEGNKIYGLLTIPSGEPPADGYKAIVFNHGYIPPEYYLTTERYTAQVDFLASNGFVVFKIDYRGHGQSEGEARGSYFAPDYTIDSIVALKSLQQLNFVDPQGIGMWGHSMAGNLVLRAMLVEPDIQAGVIFAGAVYSYTDLAEYGINDNTYRPPATPEGTEQPRRSRQLFELYGQPDSGHPFWQAISLTENIDYLSNPLQIHHAENDRVVSIEYSQDLAAVLTANDKEFEFFSYQSGGHNLLSPAYGQAMRRTVKFFQEQL